MVFMDITIRTLIIIIIIIWNFMVWTDRHIPAGFMVRCSAQTSPLFVAE